MLWTIQDSYLSAKISLCTQNDAKLSAGTIVDFIPRPLNTWSKSVQLSINRVAITVSHTDNLEVSNMINILFEKKAMHTNLGGMTMGWLDVSGKMSYLHSVTANDHADNTRKTITENKGVDKRRTSVVNADPRFVADKMIVPMFYDSDQYVTSSQSISFRWNKSSNRIVLTGSEFNYNTTASAFHHTTANTGASIAQASDSYKQALLGKLDNVQNKTRRFSHAPQIRNAKNGLTGNSQQTFRTRR